MTALTQQFRLVDLPNDLTYGNHVLTNRLLLDNLNFCTGSAGLATGSTTSDVSTANSVTYTVDGVFATAKGATANLYTFANGQNLANGGTAAFTVVPPSSFVRFIFALDASGNPWILQSSINQVGLANCVYPLMPNGYCVIGFCTLTTNATTTFTPGTTAMSAAGVTTAYFNGQDKQLLPLLADAANGAAVLNATAGEEGTSYLL